MHAKPPPVSTVQPLASALLDRVVNKCLAKDPDDRQSARGKETGEVTAYKFISRFSRLEDPPKRSAVPLLQLTEPAPRRPARQV